ncbi:MAG: hypothetical protein ACQJCO_06155 [cyanobacterium endosymbiont of Rhopalodia sterrenbergii]
MTYYFAITTQGKRTYERYSNNLEKNITLIRVLATLDYLAVFTFQQ